MRRGPRGRGAGSDRPVLVADGHGVGDGGAGRVEVAGLGVRLGGIELGQGPPLDVGRARSASTSARAARAAWDWPNSRWQVVEPALDPEAPSELEEANPHAELR